LEGEKTKDQSWIIAAVLSLGRHFEQNDAICLFLIDQANVTPVENTKRFLIREKLISK
jgi:hypothetical protein